MEKRIRLEDNMKGDAQDIVDLQDFAQKRDDHIVNDGIEPGTKYWGFGITKTSVTAIEVAPGRLYVSGPAYAREETVPIDLFAQLPLATKRIVAIVSHGEEKTNRVIQRSYMKNAQTRETEPKSVPIELIRYANVQAIGGVESATPQPPALDASYCVLGYITLDAAGITEWGNYEPNRLKSVADSITRVVELEGWRQKAGTRIDTLATDMAGLASTASRSADDSMLENAIFDIARLREAIDLPALYNNYGAEAFAHYGDSDTARSGFDAEISEGLSFPAAAEDVAQIALFNQFEAAVKTFGSGLVIPAHTHEVRVQSTGFSSSASLTEFGVQNWALVQRHHTRFRKRFGSKYVTWKGATKLRVLKRTSVGPNGEPPNSNYPVAPLVFRKEKAGELETVFQQQRNIKWQGVWKRDAAGRWYRHDAWTEPYWSFVRSDVAVSGSLRAQTFLNSQDGYLTQVGLYFVTKAPGGDVRVLITDTTEQGTPDLEGILSETTLDYDDIKVAANGTAETIVSFDPVLLKNGRRVAIVLISEGAHWVALADQASFNAGTWFASADGAFLSGSQTQDLKFNAYFAKFDKTYLQVPLAALSLPGGIANIDLLGEGYEPEGTSMVFEVKAAGGDWVTLEAYNTDAVAKPLPTLPALLEFRAVFSGTTELMPFMNLATTQQYISRPKIAFTWMSSAIALDASSDTFKMKLVLSQFDDVDHDCTVYIEDQAAPGVWIAADTVQDRVLDAEQSERTCTWALVGAIDDFAIKIEGATLDALDMWAAEELSWVAS